MRMVSCAYPCASQVFFNLLQKPEYKKVSLIFELNFNLRYDLNWKHILEKMPGCQVENT